MTQEEIIKGVLKYLYSKADKPDNGYEWREVCTLIKILEEHFNIDYAKEYYSNQIPINGLERVNEAPPEW